MPATTLRGVLRPDQPGGLELAGGRVRELVPAATTDGRVTLLEHRLAPRSLGSPVHTHARTVEISVVTEGRLGILLGEDELEAVAGDVVVKPAGIPHAFWNPADEPARFVELLTPSGFERYFAELGAIWGPEGPDLDRIGEVIAGNDIDADFATVPELTARHGLHS
jgi:mannose-6-phosphate isomerase-like protein (cupin superfamily)